MNARDLARLLQVAAAAAAQARGRLARHDGMAAALAARRARLGEAPPEPVTAAEGRDLAAWQGWRAEQRIALATEEARHRAARAALARTAARAAAREQVLRRLGERAGRR